jgi:hypothetical protein
MTMIQALGWAASILLVSFAGRIAGLDPEPLVLLMSGAAAVRIVRSGCCGARA